MNSMKFADHLSKSDIQKFNQLRRGSKQSKPNPGQKGKKNNFKRFAGN
ncbi:hypothetical protein [Peribacillus sp. TH27]|nr:hypothetical protein [Peribacillus sp. TH27]MBK5459238.1 hypothetical protein [Peribacillus sp. TH27]